MKLEEKDINSMILPVSEQKQKQKTNSQTQRTNKQLPERKGVGSSGEMGQGGQVYGDEW